MSGRCNSPRHISLLCRRAVVPPVLTQLLCHYREGCPATGMNSPCNGRRRVYFDPPGGVVRTSYWLDGREDYHRRPGLQHSLLPRSGRSVRSGSGPIARRYGRAAQHHIGFIIVESLPKR